MLGSAERERGKQVEAEMHKERQEKGKSDCDALRAESNPKKKCILQPDQRGELKSKQGL